MSAEPFDSRVTERLHGLVDDAFPSPRMRARAEEKAAALRRRRVPGRAIVVLSGAVAAVALTIVGVNTLGRSAPPRVIAGTEHVSVPPETRETGPAAAVPPDAHGTSAITGVVTSGGRPLKGANVRVAIEPCCLYREAFTGADGSYSITALPAGSYHVSFGMGGRTSWYQDKPTFGDSNLVTLDEGQQRSGIDGALLAGSSISGRVTSQRGAPVVGLWVYFDGPRYGKVETDAAGRYAVNDLPPGDYTVKFDPGPANLPYVGEYYNDKSETSQADRIHLDDGTRRTSVDAVLARA